MTTQGPPPAGRYRLRLAEGPGDLRRVQALRHLCFVEARGRPPRPDGLDRDRHDDACRHLLIEDATGGLAGGLRLRAAAGARDLDGGYAAQSYGLPELPGPLLEVGRLCVHPDARAPDVFRLAWGALAATAERERARTLLGCCSFEGTDPAPYREALALLRAEHLAPPGRQPARRAPETVPLAALGRRPDRIAALRALPPLLRSYLGLGGLVSDHAVVDRELGTLHVLVVLDVARVPPARASALRGLAAAVG